MSNSTQRPTRSPVSCAVIITLLGLVSSLISIIACLSGVTSIPQVISWFTGSRPTPTITPVLPTATLEGPLESLIAGTMIIPIDVSDTYRIGLNFKLNEIVTGASTVDLLINRCRTIGTTQSLYCYFAARQIREMGNVNLGEIAGIELDPYRSDETLVDLAVGQAFIFQAYDDHLVKFRISNLELIYATDNSVHAQMVVEFVYQPNNRLDFRGP